MLKNILLSLSILGSVLFSAQETHKAVYVKGNALLLPALVVNTGFEFQLSNKYTIEIDGLISPWKSVNGNHAQVYMGHLEGRYYFNEAFHKLYVGANAGFGLFDLTKWNYIGSSRFQRGFNIMAGVTVGYQFHWKEKWNIDVFVGGGTSQAFYHGYENVPPNWIRYDDAQKWNKSGELIPYRGGIMISYKIK